MPDRLEDAVAQYREALRLLPNSADIHFNIALVLLRIPGRENEAADELEAVLRIKPGNGLARRILAQIRASRP
jgi:cytochrome c-type biogenesis protein CcmH/NrfG